MRCEVLFGSMSPPHFEWGGLDLNLEWYKHFSSEFARVRVPMQFVKNARSKTNYARRGKLPVHPINYRDLHEYAKTVRSGGRSDSNLLSGTSGERFAFDNDPKSFEDPELP